MNFLQRIGLQSVQVEKRNSSDLQQPAQWLTDAITNIFGSQTQSGQSVTPSTAMSIASVKRCVGIIADNISVMSLKLHEITPSDGRVRIYNDPAINVLFEPNDYQTYFDFMNFMGISLAFRGNAYAVIVRDNTYSPVKLHPLHPDKCSVRLDENGDIDFRVNNQRVDYNDILHFKIFCSDTPYYGKSPIQQHAETLGITLAASNSQARTYKSGVLKFVLKSQKPVEAPAAANLKTSLDDVINGQNLSAILPSGIEMEKLSMTPQEAQFIESKRYSDEEIARIFGVPASMIGAGSNGGKSTTEQEYQYFYQSTLLAYSVNIEQQLRKKLIQERYKSTRYFKFSYNSLLRATANERAEYYNKGIRGGWLTPNEARIYEDMSLGEGLDQFYVEMNLMPSDKSAEYIDAKIEQLKASSLKNAEGFNQDPTS